MNFLKVEEDKLISFVEKHPVIYDSRQAGYWNNLVKESVWNSIGKELNKNSEICKKKWKFMRDSYNRFKKTHSLNNGSVAPKNSKDQRHQKLLFLDDVSQHRSTGLNIPKSPQELTAGSKNKKDADQLSFEEPVLVRESADEVLSSNNEKQNNDIIGTLDEWHKIEIQLNRKHPEEDELLQLWKEDEERQKLSESTLKKHEDGLELFSRHIAEILSWPPAEKAG